MHTIPRILIASSLAIIAQFRTMKWRRREQLFRAIPRNGIPIGNINHRRKNVIQKLSNELCKHVEYTVHSTQFTVHCTRYTVHSTNLCWGVSCLFSNNVKNGFLDMQQLEFCSLNNIYNPSKFQRLQEFKTQFKGILYLKKWHVWFTMATFKPIYE